MELQIVALQIQGHWSANFAHSPEMGFGGKTARDAAQRLLRAKHGVDLDEHHVVETSAVESEGRLDLMVRVSAGHYRPPVARRRLAKRNRSQAQPQCSAIRTRLRPGIVIPNETQVRPGCHWECFDLFGPHCP